MRKLFEWLAWLLMAPGDIASDWLQVGQQQNRDLIRMLINSLFWIIIAVIGLAIWTSGMPMYQ